MHLAPSALEKKEFRETWQVTALRDRVRTRYFQRKETRVLQEARRFPCLHLLYLSESQLERIKPFFPRSHGAPRVDDRRVVSDIIYGLPDVRLHPPQNSPHGVNSAQKEDSPRLIGRTKFMPFVTVMGGPFCFCCLKGRSTTTKVQPFSSTFFPIPVRFWQTEVLTRVVDCGNL